MQCVAVQSTHKAYMYNYFVYFKPILAYVLTIDTLCYRFYVTWYDNYLVIVKKINTFLWIFTLNNPVMNSFRLFPGSSIEKKYNNNI